MIASNQFRALFPQIKIIPTCIDNTETTAWVINKSIAPIYIHKDTTIGHTRQREVDDILTAEAFDEIDGYGKTTSNNEGQENAELREKYNEELAMKQSEYENYTEGSTQDKATGQPVNPKLRTIAHDMCAKEVVQHFINEETKTWKVPTVIAKGGRIRRTVTTIVMDNREATRNTKTGGNQKQNIDATDESKPEKSAWKTDSRTHTPQPGMILNMEEIISPTNRTSLRHIIGDMDRYQNAVGE